MRICHGGESFDIRQGVLWFSVRMVPLPYFLLLQSQEIILGIAKSAQQVLDIC